MNSFSLTRESSSTGYRVSIIGAMNIYAAVDAKAALLEALSEAAPVLELNLAEVEEMDTAGVQLLLMVKAEAASQGKECRILCHSAATGAVVGLYRLEPVLGAIND